MTTTIRCDIVSAEAEIFHGNATHGHRHRRRGRARHCAASRPADHAPEARPGAGNRRKWRGAVFLRLRRHPGSAAASRHRAGRHRDPRQGPRRSRRASGQGQMPSACSPIASIRSKSRTPKPSWHRHSPSCRRSNDCAATSSIEAFSSVSIDAGLLPAFLSARRRAGKNSNVASCLRYRRRRHHSDPWK